MLISIWHNYIISFVLFFSNFCYNYFVLLFNIFGYYETTHKYKHIRYMLTYYFHYFLLYLQSFNQFQCIIPQFVTRTTAKLTPRTHHSYFIHRLTQNVAVACVDCGDVASMFFRNITTAQHVILANKEYPSLSAVIEAIIRNAAPRKVRSS